MSNEAQALTKYSLFEKLYNRKPSLNEWMKFASDPTVDDMLTTKGKESIFDGIKHKNVITREDDVAIGDDNFNV